MTVVSKFRIKQSDEKCSRIDVDPRLSSHIAWPAAADTALTRWWLRRRWRQQNDARIKPIEMDWLCSFGAHFQTIPS